MNISPLNKISSRILFSLAFIPCLSHADISITARQQRNDTDGSDVIFTYVGSILTSSLTSEGATGRSGAINPSNSSIYFSPTGGNVQIEEYSAVTSAPASFGSGDEDASVFLLSGDPFAINATRISVPTDYTSGNLLSGIMYFFGTLSSLGISPSADPYVWTLSNGEKVTLTVETPPTTNPVDTAAQTNLINKIEKLKKKFKKLKKRGPKAKAKKLKKKIKKLQKQLVFNFLRTAG